MRGIKINPTNRTIGEVDVPNPNKSLQGLYDLIGCDLVQLVELDRGIVMACDEEAKCRKITGAFTFYGTDLPMGAMELSVDALSALIAKRNVWTKSYSGRGSRFGLPLQNFWSIGIITVRTKDSEEK